MHLNILTLLSLHLYKILPFIYLIKQHNAKTLQFLLRYNHLNSFFKFVKNYTNLKLNFFSDLTVVDFPLRLNRFQLTYTLSTFVYNNSASVQIRTQITEIISIRTVSTIFLSSNWFEREIWDLFGIYFFEHFRLRRILTDYGFFGYPLRKDFPTSGFLELRYDEKKQKILYEPVQFNSLTRFF